MNGVWLEIFKTGTHTSGNGVTKTYTDEDLKQIVETYNNQQEHQAPLVFGHPVTDDPAHGWIQKLKIQGNKLLAFVENISQEATEAVKKGMYKFVSCALYPNGLLRHVGLLGAVPPAVKGLKPVQFAADMAFEEYVIAEETRMPTVASILSAIRDWLVEILGREKADSLIPSGDIQYLGRPANRVVVSTIEAPQESEPVSALSYQEENDMEMQDVEMKNVKTKLQEMAAQFAELSGKVAELMTWMANTVQEEKNRLARTISENAKAEFAAFCDTLCREGKILPAEKDTLVEDYIQLLQAEQGVTFADENSKPSVKFKALLSNRQPIIKPSQTVFTKAPNIKPNAIAEEFAECANRLDIQSLQLDQQIQDTMARDNCTYEDAVMKIITM